MNRNDSKYYSVNDKDINHYSSHTINLDDDIKNKSTRNISNG